MESLTLQSLPARGPKVSGADRFRGAVSYYIEARRNQISNHPAIAEAVKDISVEGRQIVRRQSSLTALSGSNNVFSDVLWQQPHTTAQDHAQALTKPTVISHDLLKDYRSSIDEKQTFHTAVEAFRTTVKDKKKLLLVDPFSNEGHTWGSVIETLQTAAAERQRATTFWGKFSKSVSRFLRNNADTLKSWQELLPAGSEYFSIICGFLKLIFGAAAVLGDIAEEVCKAVEKIPEVIDRALDLTAAFKAKGLSADSKLFVKSDILFTSIFKLMIEVMFEMKKNWFKREFVAFFKQDTYGQGLKLAIKAVDDDTDKFVNLSNDYGLALTADSNVRLISLQEQANRIEDKEYAIYQEVRAQGQTSRQAVDYRLQTLQSEMRRQQMEHDQRQRELEQRQVEREEKRMLADAQQTSVLNSVQQQNNQVLGILSNLLASHSAIDFVSGDVREEDQEVRRLRIQNFERRRPSIIHHHIKVTLDRLSFSDDTISHDVRAALARAVDMKRKEQDRSIAILENAVFQKWVVTVRSSILSVNANCMDVSDNEPSSYVSAKLAHAITPLHTTTKINTRRPLCLAFFCAEHTADESADPDAGPAGMMRNMVSQLMSQYRDFELDSLRRIQNTNPFDAVGLLRCLRALLQELPPEVIVYFVIDAVARFEKSFLYKRETARLLKELTQLISAAQGIRATLKMLFLNPGRSLLLDELLAADEKEIINPLVRSTEGIRHRTLIDRLGDAAYLQLLE